MRHCAREREWRVRKYGERERERAIDRERESTRDSQQGGRVRCGGGDFIQNKIKRLEGCWLCGDLQTAKRLLGKAPPLIHPTKRSIISKLHFFQKNQNWLRIESPNGCLELKVLKAQSPSSKVRWTCRSWVRIPPRMTMGWFYTRQYCQLNS